MTDLLVGTRKGLFSIDRGATSYAVTDVAFLGVPVTAVLHDAARRHDLRRARPRPLRHQAPPARPEHRLVHRDRHARISRAAGRHRRRGAGVGHADGVDHRSRPPRPARCVVGGHHPRRALPVTRPRRLVGARAGSGISRAEPSGSVAATTRPASTRSASIPRDADAVLVGISCGGAWRTDDDGATWAVGTGMRAAFMPPDRAFDPVIQDPHRLARCTASPDVVWCQHHNGMFRSTDGGSTFTEITDNPVSTFGFAVAAPPRPAHRVVRSRGGRRATHPGRRAGRRHPHPRRRARPSTCSATVFPTETPITSCTGTHSRSTTAANGSRWRARRGRCGSAKTPATRGPT